MRHLNRDWYHADKEIVEVSMSNTQFAEAITSLNMGSGVPVTLSYIDGKQIQPCPEENKREEFQKEFKNRCIEMDSKVEGMIEAASMLLSKGGAVSMADRRSLVSQLQGLRQEIRSNLPFVQKSFDEQMDKTIMEGKGEIEAFFTGEITRLGVEAFQDKYSVPLIADASEVLDTPTECVKVTGG